MNWERARKPEQKQERRSDIIEAAGRCFDAGGLAAATLSAIAEETGLSKANLYRYFESRDAILLELLMQENEVWARETQSDLHDLTGSNDVEAIAQRLSRSLFERPRLCALTALSGMLYSKLSVESIVSYKLRGGGLMARTAEIVGPTLPALDDKQVALFVRYSTMILGQVWSAANPSSTIVEAKTHPELAGASVDFVSTLQKFMHVFLHGLLSDRR
ncbi:MAG: TetR/AcrR family transcriptional regulator [Myxococcota bacterium]